MAMKKPAAGSTNSRTVDYSGFSFGFATADTMLDADNRDKPLRCCKGARVVTADGVYVNGSKSTIGIPRGAQEGFDQLARAKNGTRLSVCRENHPDRGRNVTVLKVNDVAMYYHRNTEKHPLVPCKRTEHDAMSLGAHKPHIFPSHKRH